ncbi:MAG: NAD-dependent protein deacylase [Oscillospiraceae bacterium]|nr:NAD-dependent protein deacylase [Oscillospiraceae bacterium]
MDLQSMINESSRIVFFGGAGVSTESGIPDFRSADGLYNQKYRYPPEQIISHSFFLHDPEEFYRFYRDRMIYREAKPNAAHLKLAELERAGKLSAVITQNIDGLHTDAGSRNVIELHGSIRRNRCMNCGRPYTLEQIINTTGVPRCECGGIIKPDVVLYEEPLDEDCINRAINAISGADMLIIGGTSLVVQPAAGFIGFFRGKYLAVINKTPTPADKKADIVINASIGETLGAITVNSAG